MPHGADLRKLQNGDVPGRTLGTNAPRTLTRPDRR